MVVLDKKFLLNIRFSLVTCGKYKLQCLGDTKFTHFYNCCSRRYKATTPFLEYIQNFFAF